MKITANPRWWTSPTGQRISHDVLLQLAAAEPSLASRYAPEGGSAPESFIKASWKAWVKRFRVFANDITPQEELDRLENHYWAGWRDAEIHHRVPSLSIEAKQEGGETPCS